jgi:hypothetical protein
MIKDLAQYVEDETDFAIGTDLFAGFCPPTIEADRVILLESGGIPNFYLKDRKEARIQALVKAKDYHTAKDYSLELFSLLHGAVGITLPKIGAVTYFVNTCEAITVPQYLGKDEKGLHNFSTNYLLRVEET